MTILTYPKTSMIMGMPDAMNRRRLLTVGGALSLFPRPERAMAQPAGLGAEVVALFASEGGPVLRETFWSTRLSSGGRAGCPLPDFQNRTARIAAVSGGFELLAARRIEDEVRLQVRSRAQGAVKWLRLRIDRDEPSKLLKIVMQPTPTPYDRIGPTGPVSRNALGLEIESRVRFAAERDEFSGAVAVVAPDGATVCKMALGVARRDLDQPALVDTRFNLGSADQGFTALMIGRLVEQGALSFDTPLIDILPDYADQAFARACTIDHLLTHRSGRSDLSDRPMWDRNRPFVRMGDVFESFAGEPVAFAPGTSAAFSSEGFVVLGAVIEACTGLSWYDLLAAQIYVPAGMARSGHFMDVESVPELALGYAYAMDDDLGLRERLPNDAHRGYRGFSCGGGYSTVDDMIAWLRALRRGALLPIERVKGLIAEQPSGLRGHARGFKREIVAGRTLVGHGGGGPHSGIDGDHFIVWETGWTVSVLGNYDAPFARALARDIGRWVALQPGDPA